MHARGIPSSSGTKGETSATAMRSDENYNCRRLSNHVDPVCHDTVTHRAHVMLCCIAH
eukprot:m.1562097 g.1562097  ORF g.1562097 m.1562097 type:complete len:58 (-) comp25280_c0_seq1:111-284(-)